MKKIYYIILFVALHASCNTQREIADRTFNSGWMRYPCGIYSPVYDQYIPKTVASILKEVNGVYYSSEDVKIGKYRFTLEKITDKFFKVKGKDIYIELRGDIPNRDEYHGILEVKPIKMQHPWKENQLYNTTAEFFHLAPDVEEY